MTYPDSHYAATRHPAPDRPPLAGAAEADICVVGGGYTGLSAALHLAGAGRQVTLLEAERIGWGASGRNGGQIVTGLNAGLDKVRRTYGREAEAMIGRLLTEGAATIRDLIERHGIDCDLRRGNLFAAMTRPHMRELEETHAAWARHGHGDTELVTDSRAHVASDRYVGGMIDWAGGQMHPLNLALGEAAALERLGGTVHEGSRVTSVDTGSERPVVRTAQGEVWARTVVLAGNAYLTEVPEIRDRIMPVSTQMIATQPLGELGAELLPTGLAVEDMRYILDYYRLAADGSLLFGGGSVYGGKTPADIQKRLRRNLEQTFPQLAGVPLTHAWSGWFALSFSRVPQMGRIGHATYFAQGYSGHGVTGSHLFGRILAAAIRGDTEHFDAFAALKHMPFPGGRSFRVPYSVLGAWWYGLRDRLGI